MYKSELDAMYEEFAAWCDAHPHYEAGSADEMFLALMGDGDPAERPPLVRADLYYLRDFIERWESAEAREEDGR